MTDLTRFQLLKFLRFDLGTQKVALYGSKYSRMGQVKFVEDSL